VGQDSWPLTGFTAWVLDGSGWTRKNALPNSATNDARRSRLACSSNRDECVFVSNEKTFIMNGDTWVEAPQPPRQASAADITVVDHPALARYVMLRSGGLEPRYLDSLWTLEKTNPVGAANVVRFDTSSLLPADATLVSVTPTIAAAGFSAALTSWLPPQSVLLADGGALLPDGGRLTNPDGGTFFSTSALVAGVRLETWDTRFGTLIALAENTASTRQADGGAATSSDAGVISAQLAEVTATIAAATDAGAELLPRLISNNTLRFQVTTRGGSDLNRSPAVPAELAIDHAEVKVRYRLP